MATAKPVNMEQRIVSIWFPKLLSEWAQRRQPALKGTAFGLAAQQGNHRVLMAVSGPAEKGGVLSGMAVADARALLPELELLEHDPLMNEKLLKGLGEWCIRYSPIVAIDLPDGLLVDASGCAHLWGGEKKYLEDIHSRLAGFGYSAQLGMADTAGSAWALARFSEQRIAAPGTQQKALAPLPAKALRLEPAAIERLNKLGLQQVGSFMQMPRHALRRRFGQQLLSRLDQALGYEIEILNPLQPPAPYRESLPCPEPVKTDTAIRIALQQLLEGLCLRLVRESRGLRSCSLLAYRLDGQLQKISIGTSRPSRNVKHLFRLFENSISSIEPDLGIELFMLEAAGIEELHGTQDAMWEMSAVGETPVAELLDRLAGKTGIQAIHRYLPSEHYWPERSIKEAVSLTEQPDTAWRIDLPRPVHVLLHPEAIEVSVPQPDYPPLLFRHKGSLHIVRKADGPERIEQEWWLQKGAYRDYYSVEDERGARYWIFRLGDYRSGQVKWFLHGFFA